MLADGQDHSCADRSRVNIPPANLYHARPCGFSERENRAEVKIVG